MSAGRDGARVGVRSLPLPKKNVFVIWEPFCYSMWAAFFVLMGKPFFGLAPPLTIFCWRP